MADTSEPKGNQPEENHDDSDHRLSCPQCNSRLVRRSMRRTFMDRFRSVFGKWPYRCQMCHTRFTGPQDPEFLAREKAEAVASHQAKEKEDEVSGTR